MCVCVSLFLCVSLDPQDSLNQFVHTSMVGEFPFRMGSLKVQVYCCFLYLLLVCAVVCVYSLLLYLFKAALHVDCLQCCWMDKTILLVCCWPFVMLLLSLLIVGCISFHGLVVWRWFHFECYASEFYHVLFSVILGVPSPSFQGSFFLENLWKPRENGSGFWQERWLKRMGVAQIKQQGQTAGFGPYFHLLRANHFGYRRAF